MEHPRPKNIRDGLVVKATQAKAVPALWGEKATTSAMAWCEVNGAVLLAACQAALDADCAIMIATTRDHSAVRLRLYVGKDHRDVYVGTVEALEGALLELVDALSSKAEDLRASFGLPT